MRKSMLAAFIALLGSHGAATAASCKLPDMADKVDLKQVRGSALVTVPVAINGVPKQFLLDIGTRPTRISPATVTALSLPEALRATESIDTPRFTGDLNFGSSSVQATVRRPAMAQIRIRSALASAWAPSPSATPPAKT